MDHSKYSVATTEDIVRLRRRIVRAGLPPRRTDANVVVGTWNIQKFGGLHADWSENTGSPKRNLRALAIIAEVVRCFDVDQEGVQDGLMAMHEDFRKAIKLADPARRVDREAARSALHGVEGLASVVWLDHENLFVLVDRNELRTQAVIDAICIRLEPLGDTLGVVVNLQSTAARTGEEQATLSRNCQLQPGDRAFLQRERQVDVVPAHIRTQQQGAQAQADARGDRSRQVQASLEILMESTPELPADPRRQ